MERKRIQEDDEEEGFSYESVAEVSIWNGGKKLKFNQIPAAERKKTSGSLWLKVVAY